MALRDGRVGEAVGDGSAYVDFGTSAAAGVLVANGGVVPGFHGQLDQHLLPTHDGLYWVRSTPGRPCLICRLTRNGQ